MPGDDDASEPAPAPSAAPPLGGPPVLGPVGDATGESRSRLRARRTGRTEEVRADAELEGAEDESDGAMTAGPSDGAAVAFAEALVALTGGPAAGGGGGVLENALTRVASADRRDNRRLGSCRAAGSAGELADATGASLCVAVRLDADSLLGRVLEELTAPMISARTSSPTASARRRQRRMVARLGRGVRL